MKDEKPMPISWSRVRRRIAALEMRTRRAVVSRLNRRDTEDGCILLRAALRKAGIDPATNWALRSFGQPTPRPLPENSPERRAADTAFAAADPVLSRRRGFAVEVREHALTLPRDLATARNNTFFEWVAWAIVRLGICGPPPQAEPPPQTPAPA